MKGKTFIQIDHAYNYNEKLSNKKLTIISIKQFMIFYENSEILRKNKF